MQDGIEQGWFRRPHDKVTSERPPDMHSIVLTAKEIAAALAYLHQEDVLHGDLTGNNILLASSHKDARAFTVKVTGLSCFWGLYCPGFRAFTVHVSGLSLSRQQSFHCPGFKAFIVKVTGLSQYQGFHCQRYEQQQSLLLLAVY